MQYRRQINLSELKRIIGSEVRRTLRESSEIQYPTDVEMFASYFPAQAKVLDQNTVRIKIPDFGTVLVTKMGDDGWSYESSEGDEGEIHDLHGFMMFVSDCGFERGGASYFVHQSVADRRQLRSW